MERLARHWQRAVETLRFNDILNKNMTKQCVGRRDETMSVIYM